MSLNPNATPAHSAKEYVRHEIAIVRYDGEARPCPNKPERLMRFAIAKDKQGRERKLIVFGSAEAFASCSDTHIVAFHEKGASPEECSLVPKSLAEVHISVSDFV